MHDTKTLPLVAVRATHNATPTGDKPIVPIVRPGFLSCLVIEFDEADNDEKKQSLENRSHSVRQ